jgi:hypothetical protein
MRPITALLLFLSLTTFVHAQNSSPVPESEEALVEASPNTKVSSQDVVRSRHHMAWVEKQGNLRMVYLDGQKQGGHYNDVAYLQFSADESHLVFATRSDTEWWLVLDGKDQPEHYISIGGLQWQPHSNVLAYTACSEKKKCHFYVDGKATGPEYERADLLKYSSDGKHFAYMIYRNKEWYAVLDGKEIGPGMDSMDGDHWGFSRTGRFYMAICHGHKVERNHQTVRSTEKWTYEVDGVAGPEFGVISPIEFSGDDRHFTYAGLDLKLGWVRSTPQASVVLDGAVKAIYPGRKIAGGVHLNTGVHDLYPRVYGMSNPSFDPGGKLVYAASRESGDVTVFVGDEPGQGFTEIVSPIIFSPDAQHFAYVAQQGENLVEVHDNHPGITFTVPGRTRSCYVRWIYVTNEPRHHLVYELVCGGTRYKLHYTEQALRRVVIDGQSGPEYDVVGLGGFRYTEDWKHYGYEVHGVNGDHVLLNIDGKETKSYDGVVSGSLEIHPETGEASFIAREGEKLVRVKWPLESAKSQEAPKSP